MSFYKMPTLCYSLTATDTDLNPAAPWQVELYAADLKNYAAASNAHRHRVEAPERKFDMRFQPATKSSKDLERHGVAWCPNEIWSGIFVLECVCCRRTQISSSCMNALGSMRVFPTANSRLRSVPLTQALQRRRREPAQRPHSHRRRLPEERVLRR